MDYVLQQQSSPDSPSWTLARFKRFQDSPIVAPKCLIPGSHLMHKNKATSSSSWRKRCLKMISRVLCATRLLRVSVVLGLNSSRSGKQEDNCQCSCHLQIAKALIASGRGVALVPLSSASVLLCIRCLGCLSSAGKIRRLQTYLCIVSSISANV